MFQQTKEEFTRLFRPIVMDTATLPVLMEVRQALFVLDAIQFSITRTDMPDSMKQELVHMGRRLQDRIAQLHPEARAMLEIGWQR